MSDKNINTHLMEVNEKLKAIKPLVTSKDRKAFIQKFGGSLPQVSNCLNGSGRTLEYVLKMLEFFTENISVRKATLKNIEEKFPVNA